MFSSYIFTLPVFHSPTTLLLSQCVLVHSSTLVQAFSLPHGYSVSTEPDFVFSFSKLVPPHVARPVCLPLLFLCYPVCLRSVYLLYLRLSLCPLPYLLCPRSVWLLNFRAIHNNLYPYLSSIIPNPGVGYSTPVFPEVLPVS